MQTIFYDSDSPSGLIRHKCILTTARYFYSELKIFSLSAIKFRNFISTILCKLLYISDKK